jgi:hypothetical protein
MIGLNLRIQRLLSRQNPLQWCYYYTIHAHCFHWEILLCFFNQYLKDLLINAAVHSEHCITKQTLHFTRSVQRSYEIHIICRLSLPNIIYSLHLGQIRVLVDSEPYSEHVLLVKCDIRLGLVKRSRNE